MTRSAVVLLALMSAPIPVAAQSGGTTGPDVPVVVSAGEGVVKRAPDRAWVTISAESRARTSREAQRLNAEAMTGVMAKLKSAGIGADALQTSGIDLQPEFDYAGGKQTLRGYVARNSVHVRVDDLPKLGEVVDAAVGAGATSVSGVRFDLRDRAAAERDALRLAVEDARARAAAAAAGAGMRVDRILKIEEQRVAEMPPPRPMMTMAARQAGQPAETPVAAGELEVRATVTLTVAIK